PLDLRVETSHLTGDGHSTDSILNKQLVFVQVAFHAVQGDDPLSRARARHHDFPFPQPLKVKGVQGVSQLQQNVVRYVNDVVEGPHPRRFQAVLQPRGRRFDANPVHDQTGVTGTKVAVFDSDFVWNSIQGNSQRP